jgi:ribonuclease G
MTEEILVNHRAHETRVAVVQQGVVQELLIERAVSRGLAGNLYLGRVSRVLPGMQSAFIDIGLERAAFLHVADLWQSRHSHAPTGTQQPIEKLLFEGQPLLVGDEQGREALRSRMQALVPVGEKGGFIVRTLAEDASSDELAADIAYLRRRWQQILDGSRTRTAPSLIYQELALTQRVLRDLAGEATSAVIVDSGEALALMQEFASAWMPTMTRRLRLHASERPVFELHGVEQEIERALSRRVDLKSGGYLIIDQTEAMTTIDVNTGSFVGGRNFEDTVFRTNLEAAHAIARQLRLRNLGGIIVVDLIDMRDNAHRDAVLAELRKAAQRDRTRIGINGFTSLGLVEITRKRTRESLARVLCEPCPTCSGTGQIKTARTVCYEILREIQREAGQFNPREFRLVAAQSVVDLFLEEEAQSLAALCDAIGRQISLMVETTYAQEHYDIVLL